MLFCLLLGVQLMPGIVMAGTWLEYVAHACFVVESATGTRVVIDPYNGHRWLGYGFPRGIPADAVLITHPHYDHDADYYFDGIPVFRREGTYRIEDISVTGVLGKHADPYGKEFDQTNVVWLVETGGLRLAHLGDTGPLAATQISALQGVDVLMIPIDGDDHILKPHEVNSILEALEPGMVVPMHYRIPSLSPLPRSLGPIDPWLEDRSKVRRLEKNRLELRAGDRTVPEIVVFKPHPAVRAWSGSLARALARADEADDLFTEDPPRAVALMQQAVDAAPQVIMLWWGLGMAMEGTDRIEEAVAALEQGLTRATGDDWSFTYRARALLARLYARQGKENLAARQYRIVRDGSFNLDLRKEAEAYLAARVEP